jgi:23S rRNA (guanine2445-N2)-methyltransferase / 23S rRNA (guanine2069-N7)-methyltransferase
MKFANASVSSLKRRFYVNFEDYLDTGLFLDHRPIRLHIQQQAKGKHILNLFAYTGTASVHAAIGGASSTTSVDMSKTYLDWAQRNMDLNQVKSDNYFIRADCKEWLEEQTTKPKRDQAYDLIFLDPP